MVFKSSFTGMLVAFLVTSPVSLGQSGGKTATVHLRVVNCLGEDLLGDAQVELFRSAAYGQDFSKRFQQNVARNITYGVYHLRARAPGFYSADRDILVFQPEVWVVTGLSVGEEDGPTRSRLSGIVRNRQRPDQAIWIRLGGVHLGVLMDTRVSDAGTFELVGMPLGSYVLTTSQGGEISDTRPIAIQTPKLSHVVIDLAKKEIY